MRIIQCRFRTMTVKPPELSIITITYNDPAGLEATLRSLQPLAGSSLSWEHVIVDSSPEMNEHLFSEARVRRLVSKPAGIYSAMNFGVEAAKGEFLWFLNGGDRLKNAEALLSAVRALREAPSADIAHSTAELYRQGKFLYAQPPRTGIFPMLGINRICHQALLYRAKLIRDLSGFSEEFQLAADYELHLRAHARGARTVIVPGTLVEYDMGGQSATSTGKALREFGTVHEKLGRAGQLPYIKLHRLVLSLESARITITRALTGTRVGAWLRNARYALKRLG